MALPAWTRVTRKVIWIAQSPLYVRLAYDRLVNDLCVAPPLKKKLTPHPASASCYPCFECVFLCFLRAMIYVTPSCHFFIHWTLFFVLFSCSCCFPPHFFFCILLLTGKLIVNVPCFIPVTVLLLRVHMYFVSLERDRTLLYRVLDDGLHQATLDPNLHISVPKLLLFFFFLYKSLSQRAGQS